MREGVDIMGFAAKAGPGERLEYARGDAPPSDLVREMRGLVDAGVLHPVRVRDGSGFRFLVQRGRGDFTGALSREQARLSRGPSRRRRVKRTSFTLVYDMIVSAARRSMPCPTNDEIAQRCGLKDRLAASYRMRRLVAAGKIAVDDQSPRRRRVVTILSGPHAGLQTRESWL